MYRKIQLERLIDKVVLAVAVSFIAFCTLVVYQNGAIAQKTLKAPLPSAIKIFCDKEGNTECDSAKLKEKLPFTVDDKDVKKKLSSKTPNYNGLTISVAAVITGMGEPITRTLNFDIVKDKCKQRGKPRKWIRAVSSGQHSKQFKSKGLCSFLVVPDKAGVWVLLAQVNSRKEKLFVTEPQKIKVG
jgi:hypothetical protein